MCRHHVEHFPAGNENMAPNVDLKDREIGRDFSGKDGWSMYYGESVPGFPAHPHRGFETITLVEKGIVDHADSRGNAGRYGYGDVQWLTAGAGIQHSEMFPLLNMNDSNPTELLQIWLNLPKKNKLSEPDYKMMWNETIPVINHVDDQGNGVEIKLIAGDWDDVHAITPPIKSWAADTSNQVCIWKITLSAFATITLPKTKKELVRDLYFYKGQDLKVDDCNFETAHLVSLHSQMETKLTAGDSDCEVLILQGLSIDEPIAQYGPFVMNNNQELHSAYADFENTQFGGWPWPKPDMVHGREQSRFTTLIRL